MAWVEVRDEQTAAVAAADEAQATGQPAVCAGTYEAGRTHLIQALYGAHRPVARATRTGGPLL